MNKFNGYILPMVLIFLSICAYVTIENLNILRNELKNVTENLQAIQYESDLKNKLRQIENKLLHENFCMQSSLPVNALLLKSFAWWQSHACQAQFTRGIIFYFSEFLQTDPCATVSSYPDRLIEYIRFNSLALLSNGESILQQTIFTRLSSKMKVCLNNIHVVNLGVQSQRILPVKFNHIL